MLWTSVVCAGVYEMTSYDVGAGAVSPAPIAWPADSAIVPAPHGVTVVMFAVPGCPCTRASQHELDEIMRDAPATTRFIVTSDRGEARRFGARTSGFVVVYDAVGALRFSGGITVTRGHIGHNLGHVLVDELVHGLRNGTFQTPVFGCSLEET